MLVRWIKVRPDSKAVIMMQDVQTQINVITLEEYHRITQKLISEAIREWDEIGQGCFKDWIQWVVGLKWLELVRSN